MKMAPEAMMIGEAGGCLFSRIGLRAVGALGVIRLGIACSCCIGNGITVLISEKIKTVSIPT